MNLLRYIKNMFGTQHGRISMLLTCVWGQPLLSFVNGLAGKIIGEIGGYSSYVITVLVVLYSSPALLKRMNRHDSIFYWAFVFFYIIQAVLYPENASYIIDYSFVVLICTVPVYFVGCNCDIVKVDKLFYWLSVIFVILQFFYSFFYLSSYESSSYDYDENEHMGTAYSLLAFTLYIIWSTFRNPNVFNIGLSLLGAFQILTCGVRTPFLFIFIFIIIYALIFSGISIKKKMLVVAVFLFAGVFFLIYSNFIFTYLIDVLGRLNMSDRIVQRFINDELMQSDDRVYIYDKLFRALDNGDAFGLGLFGSWNITGLYAHNIFLDFWCSFGYIPGSFVLLAIFALIIKAYHRSTRFERQFLLILFFMGVMQMLVSNYFLFNLHFFMLLGYCVGRIRRFKLM